ncbi:MAG: hypothetical protein GYA17_16125 [Chloroflexi bacterium]|nr:hypothetical protein [Chloroflexota bacterium]
MDEPSVLDYIKAKLHLTHEQIEIPLQVSPSGDGSSNGSSELIATQTPEDQAAPGTGKWFIALPVRLVLAMCAAILAQVLLEPPQPRLPVAVGLYVFSAVMCVWALLDQSWTLPELEEKPFTSMPMDIRRNPFLLSIPLILVAFILFTGNRFTPLNMLVWGLTIFLVLRSLWLPGDRPWIKGALDKVRAFVRHPEVRIHLSGFQLLFILVALVAIYFRFSQLPQIPGEMFSDHAEKLLDVSDVLNGQTSIFFPRNTGREAIQMYLTATIATLLGTGLSFMSLKIGTALAGLFTLPYIYLLGKEIGNRWVGLLAFFMAGIAYWPNVISRIGLRFPLYPLFAAPFLYYLIRGLRNSNRNDFILAGLALGIGLHGYSPMRIVPFVAVAAVAIYLLHKSSRGGRWQTIFALGALAFVSLVVFLPLLRYMTEDPDMFGYRAFSRLGTTERAFPGPVWLIFLSNLWNGVTMFFWKDGNIWVHSITNRPALDVVTAAFFFVGIILLSVRYIRKRDWLDLFLILSIPLLMMPSILSLAFPDENPSLNRTGGAIIPVFIIAAIGVESVFANINRSTRTRTGKMLVGALGVTLLAWTTFQNYDLVFRQFKTQFYGGAWNTTQIGHVIRSFADSEGALADAFVVPYPYWVDTRVVGINAGDPLRDYALWPEDFETTLPDKNAKLFIVKPDNTEALAKLEELYPQGWVKYYNSPLEGKDFLGFYVPPQS